MRRGAKGAKGAGKKRGEVKGGCAKRRIQRFCSISHAQVHDFPARLLPQGARPRHRVTHPVAHNPKSTYFPAWKLYNGQPRLHDHQLEKREAFRPGFASQRPRATPCQFRQSRRLCGSGVLAFSRVDRAFSTMPARVGDRRHPRIIRQTLQSYTQFKGMAFKRWGCEFEGPWPDTKILKPRQGVWVLWRRSGPRWDVIEVGESGNIRASFVRRGQSNPADRPGSDAEHPGRRNHPGTAYKGHQDGRQDRSREKEGPGGKGAETLYYSATYTPRFPEEARRSLAARIRRVTLHH